MDTFDTNAPEFGVLIEPTMTAVEESISSLEQSLSRFDDMSTLTIQTRRELLAKTLPAVMAMDFTIDERTDPELISSKARFLSETRQLLNDMDSSALRHASLKMKKQAHEDSQSSNFNVVEMLKTIGIRNSGFNNTATTVLPSDTELDSLLEGNLKKHGLEVLDTELEMGSNNLPTEETEQF